MACARANGALQHLSRRATAGGKVGLHGRRACAAALVKELETHAAQQARAAVATACTSRPSIHAYMGTGGNIKVVALQADN